MADKKDLDKIKEPLKKLQEASEYVEKYSKTARELMAAGKDVSELQKVAAGLEGIEKFSKGMQLAGFGVSAVEVLIGGNEEKDDQILEAVKELQGEIHDMWTDIGKRIDSFEAKFEEAIASLKLFPALSALLSLKDDLKTYIMTGSDVNLTLGHNNTEDIKSNFMAIGNNLGDLTDGVSALTTAYEAENGSFTIMRGLVSMYLDIAFMMPSAYALVNRLCFEQGKTAAIITEEQMEMDLAEPWRKILMACEDIITKLSVEEDANIETMLEKLPGAISHPQMVDGNGKAVATDANSANPNPGENSFHIPAQKILEKLVGNWPDVSFWVIVGQKYLNKNWTVVNPKGSFVNTNFYRLISPPQGGGNYTVTVFWTRKPANSAAPDQVKTLFKDSYEKLTESTLGYENYGAVGYRAYQKTSTYKGYVYQLGLAQAVDQWPELTTEVSGGTGAGKNRAWAMRSNAYERTALWLYPTWNPLDENAKTTNKEPIIRVTKTGDNGVAYVLIW